MILDSLTVYDAKIHIAELSKVLRAYQGISQDQLAEDLDMSRVTIQNLERPKNVTLDTFLKVLERFELLEKFDSFILENIEDKNITPLY
ncbi:helix-turn-helix transcriptional regulator [Pedobacter miscanthi]|uniref:helix-turn-helix transcriptional regulator n=1 Tax=Pedobacter miscanthi TaxID=2259170 RepID=UPI002930A0F1|nr:helix-turn-helix transcriptional regulator [Pedobacter miscanthi]